jgi:DNA-binding MarR family transcriptional regulator
LTEPAAPPPGFLLLTEVGIIAQLSGAKLEAVLPYRMTLPQFRVLNHFVRLGGERNVNRLAQAFQVAKPTMGGVVESLRKKDLVTVTPDPGDKLSKLVAISEKGREAHAQSLALISPEIAKIEAVMGGDAMERVIPELQRLRRYLDDNR